MDLKGMILNWLLGNIKVERETIERALDAVDQNGDGYIDLGELVEVVRYVRNS